MEELDLRKLIHILLTRWWVIVSTLFLGALSAFLITFFLIEPVYSAKATLYVYNTDKRDSTITTSDISVSKTLVDTYIIILKSDAVLRDVAEEVDLGYSAEQIRKMINANSVNNTEIFQVVVNNTNPEHAQIIANTLVEIGPPEIIRVVQAGSVEVIDYAVLPTEPSSPSLTRNTAVGALLGVVLSVMAVLVFEMLDTRIKTEDDLTEQFNVPVIGVIPFIGETQKSERGRNGR